MLQSAKAYFIGIGREQLVYQIMMISFSKYML